MNSWNAQFANKSSAEYHLSKLFTKYLWSKKQHCFMNNLIRCDTQYESRNRDIDGEPDLVWYPEMKTRCAFSEAFQPLMWQSNQICIGWNHLTLIDLNLCRRGQSLIIQLKKKWDFTVGTLNCKVLFFHYQSPVIPALLSSGYMFLIWKIVLKYFFLLPSFWNVGNTSHHLQPKLVVFFQIINEDNVKSGM